MFQQFKNIFPGASMNIRTLTNSVGLDNEWSKGVERLEAIKNEFHSLNSMLLNRAESSTSLSSQVPERESVTSIDSIRRIIEKLDNDIADIHHHNMDNYEKSKIANSLLERIKELGDMHHNVCKRLEHINEDIDEIRNSILTINGSALHLKSMMLNLEDEIDKVVLDREKKELDRWKKEQEDLLLEYIQSKRDDLKEKESVLKSRYEEYDRIQQQKKLEVYEANFNAELEDYRRRRMTEVSSLYSRNDLKKSPTIPLEEVQIDYSSKDELENFLGSDDEDTLVKQSMNKDNDTEVDDNDEIEILPDEDYHDG